MLYIMLIHHMEFICSTSKEVQDLAKKIENPQPVGYHPEVSVLAAEKRWLPLKWFSYELEIILFYAQMKVAHLA